MNNPTIGDPVVTVPAVTYTGRTAHLVHIQAAHVGDQPAVRLVGLGGDHAWLTRDRLYAALIHNAGLVFPAQPLTLTILGREIPAGDSGLDLAFALTLLAATGQVPADEVTGLAGLAELGLDGSLRPVSGLTARAQTLADAAIPTTVVAPADLPTATAILGNGVQAAATVADLVDTLRRAAWLRRPPAWPTAPALTGAGLDLAQVAADHPGRRALEVAAAGGHHLALTGPPASGCLLLAQLLPGLLPDIDELTAHRVAALYRQAGLLAPDAPVLRRPPWQVPHHTSSLPALTGTTTRPGAVGLAHAGVLLCDDAAEWPTRAVQALLSALHDGQVVTARGDVRTVYPARFQMVVTGRDCPQANTHSDGHCDCSPVAVARYRQRLTPLMDASDIRVTLPAPTAGAPAVGEASHLVAARVARARAAAAARWARYGLTLNRQMGSAALSTDLAESWARRVAALQIRADAAHLPFPAASRVLAVAWTLADLAGRPRPDEHDEAEAIALHGAPPSATRTSREES